MEDVTLIFFLIYCIFFSDSIERAQRASSKRNNRAGPQSDSVLGLLRLDHSTEQALIREAPPGHITFALLVEDVTARDAVKSPLVQAFADVVYPYSG